MIDHQGLLKTIKQAMGCSKAFLRGFLIITYILGFASASNFVRPPPVPPSGVSKPTYIGTPKGGRRLMNIITDGIRMDSNQSGPNKGRDKNKHVWTPEEDDILVEILVQLVISGKAKSDNGFRPGTFSTLEKAFEMKIPGCGIKANPHIKSRVKTLKSKYNAIQEMITLGSGFGWDNEKNMVTAERDVFDSWARSHPAANGLFGKAFPYFEDLGIIFGKDRANGKEAFSPVDLAEEVGLEDYGNSNNNINFVAADESINQPILAIRSEGGLIRSHRKRNRSGDDKFPEWFSTMVEAMSRAAKSIEKLVDVFCELPINPITKVYEEVGKIDGLNENEILEASEIIMADLVKVNILFSMPDNMKKKWVEKLLQ